MPFPRQLALLGHVNESISLEGIRSCVEAITAVGSREWS